METREELENTARQWITLWCAPVDWGLYYRLHAENFEDCSPAGRPNDKAGFAGGLAAFVAAFPDLQTSVEDLVVDESRSMVTVRWSAEGTNRAEFLRIGPTNRLTHITGIEVIEIQAGQITRRWGEWDITDHRHEEPAE